MVSTCSSEKAVWLVFRSALKAISFVASALARFCVVTQKFGVSLQRPNFSFLSYIAIQLSHSQPPKFCSHVLLLASARRKRLGCFLATHAIFERSGLILKATETWIPARLPSATREARRSPQLRSSGSLGEKKSAYTPKKVLTTPPRRTIRLACAGAGLSDTSRSLQVPAIPFLLF